MIERVRASGAARGARCAKHRHVLGLGVDRDPRDAQPVDEDAPQESPSDDEEVRGDVGIDGLRTEEDGALLDPEDDALLVRVASLAVSRGCARFEWQVLDWNEPALGFYRSLGARALEEWVPMRVDGEALAALARMDAPIR